MRPILYDVSGIHDIYIGKIHIIWVFVVIVAMIAFTWAQSYAQAKNAQLDAAKEKGDDIDESKRWSFGKTTGLGLAFAIVGGVIAYFLWSAVGLPKVRVFEPELPIRIYSYGFMLTLAFIVGSIVTVNYAKKYGLKDKITTEMVLDLLVFIIIGSILGARLVYVLLKYEDYLAYDTIGEEEVEQLVFNFRATMENMAAFTQGGLSVHGGVLGAIIAGLIYTGVKKVSFGRMADLFAPGLALGTAFGRLGCFLNGCCYGVATEATAWYAVRFPTSEHTDVTTDPRHPAQLYMFLINVVIFLLLRSRFKDRKFAGHMFLMWIGLYSVGRFIQEFSRFKESSDVLPFGYLTYAQLASIILAIIAFLVIAEMSKREALSQKLATMGKKAEETKERKPEKTDEKKPDKEED